MSVHWEVAITLDNILIPVEKYSTAWDGRGFRKV